MHYLDNAATTSVLPEVAGTIHQTMLHCFGNPSSLYTLGAEAEEILTQSRETLGAILGCRPKEVVFTSSGTESSNIALLGAAKARRHWGSHIVTTGYEHPCVQNTLRHLADKEGFSLTVIPPDAGGNIDPGAFAAAVRGDTVLAAALHVNNETGAHIDVASLAKRVKEKNNRTAFHVDGVQAFCKLPFSLADTKIDSYGISGHKIHAPKGVGALFLRQGFHYIPPFYGGGQEGGARPGTENIPYIAGLAKAAEIAAKSLAAHTAHIAALRAQLMQGLAALGVPVQFNSPENAYPGIVNISLPGVRSETMLHHLAAQKVYVSSGSACNKGEPSHTLTAMGLPPAQVDTALRISFDGYTAPADIAALLAALPEGLTKTGLRR